MIKRFFEEESKSPIMDFLLWLLVYPFVIAFSVACVAFSVANPSFISSLCSIVAIILACLGFNSWKKQKVFDLEVKLLESLKKLNQKVLSLRYEIRLGINFGEICDRYANQLMQMNIDLEIDSLVINKNDELADLLKKNERLYGKLVTITAYKILSHKLDDKKSVDELDDKKSVDELDDKKSVDELIQSVFDESNNLIKNFKL